ncbi:LysE/ArgO family amino acid transporter [Paenibacillus paeoniae]|uniref:Amino acid transporter n=1 Tax=Paenibacillus paeoniae TaxID=2292705 RepID=A0A371PN20_9BACL|nr:LysE family transporter [Paenibacillus paeoniae]REK77592.1 amino acid transporter [Paenibacillus paeoniae]
MIGAAIHGFILALGLILPLGAQNTFVFTQGTVHKRFIKVLPVIVTAALCDTILIALAVLGVSVIVLENDWIKALLYLLGCGFLLYTGWVTWRNRNRVHTHSGGSNGFSARKQVGFAFTVSLLNPHAILDTVGVIGTSSIQYAGLAKLVFAILCILTSWLWFISLGAAGQFIGQRVGSSRILSLIPAISAVIMWGTALYLGFHLILLLQERI